MFLRKTGLAPFHELVLTLTQQSSVRKELEVRRFFIEATFEIHETRLLTLMNSYNVTPEELFDLFGKFGAIRYVMEIWTVPHVSS